MSQPIQLQVSRPTAACVRCRANKTKCDGALPACSACERANKAAECSFSNDRFAKGKERSYPAFLEQRFADLQKKLLNEARSRTNSEGQVSPRHLQVQQADVPRKDSGSIDELVANFGVLAVNATTRDFLGFTNLMSVSRLVLAAASKDVPGHSADPLPSRREAKALGDHYFTNVHPILPVIEETSFQAALNSVYDLMGDYALPIHQWIIRLVLATSIISGSQRRGDTSHRKAAGYVSSALTYADLVLRLDSVDNLQAILLLIQYAEYDPRWLDDWILVGAATRAVIDLGLHQDPALKPAVSKRKLDIRRGVYTCAYTLDRSTSIAMDRAFSFSDQSTNVDVAALSNPRPGSPLSSHEWGRHGNIGLEIYHLHRIQSEYYQRLHQSSRKPMSNPYTFVWPLLQKSQSWLEQLPTTLSSSVRHCAELAYLYCNICLLGPSLAIPDIAELAQNLIFENAIEYAIKLQAATDDASDRLWLTSLDARRALKVGKIFVQTFAKYEERLVAGTPPYVDEPGSEFAPSKPHTMRTDNYERALAFSNQMSKILGGLGARFGIERWAKVFDAEALRVNPNIALSSDGTTE